MTQGRFAAIVLAAGFSSRMKRFKPLLPVGDQTIADRVISLFVENGVDVTLVTGYRQELLLSSLKKWDIAVASNPSYELGMFSSIQAGIRQLKPGYQAFFVMPVDIPLVRQSTISRLMYENINCPDKIIYPEFAGQRGHPPLIPSSWKPAILDWKQDGGLKAVLSTKEESEKEVKVPDRFILFDIDSMADYKALAEAYRRYELPTREECEVILKDICMVSTEVGEHCAKVSEIANRIALKLIEAGHPVDVELIRASSFLHDICKGQPEHPAAGGQILRCLGFAKAAEIVEAHADLSRYPQASLESRVVFLADKLVLRNRLVAVEERYRNSEQKFGLNPAARDKIEQRKMEALKAKRELEALMGCPLEDVVLPGSNL